MSGRAPAGTVVVPWACVVQKFGGTSVADPDRIQAVAEHIVRTRRGGDDVVVVVSAMGKTTDDLERLAHEVSAAPPAREMDMLLTVGRADLDRAALHGDHRPRRARGVASPARRPGIVTDTAHRKAKILEIRADRLRERARRPGASRWSPASRACRPTRDITTLGRGGSDTTAVALAAALGADVCEIYTDVAGRVHRRPAHRARRRAGSTRLSYDEMLEMAATGGRVLALRSVEFARNYGVPRARAVELHVGAGHLGATREEPKAWNKPIISGVTHDISEAKVTIFQVPDRPGIAATCSARSPTRPSTST